MQPNQHLFAVVWQVRGGVLQSMREVGRDGDLLGERMLAVLAHATMPYRSLMRTCASMGIPIDLCLAYTGFPATSERKGNSMDLSTIARLYASLSTTWLIRITEEEATAAEAMVATMRLLSHALAASVAAPERPREVLLQEREAHIREAAAIAQGRLGVIAITLPPSCTRRTMLGRCKEAVHSESVV